MICVKQSQQVQKQKQNPLADNMEVDTLEVSESMPVFIHQAFHFF